MLLSPRNSISREVLLVVALCVIHSLVESKVESRGNRKNRYDVDNNDDDDASPGQWNKGRSVPSPYAGKEPKGMPRVQEKMDVMFKTKAKEAGSIEERGVRANEKWNGVGRKRRSAPKDSQEEITPTPLNKFFEKSAAKGSKIASKFKLPEKKNNPMKEIIEAKVSRMIEKNVKRGDAVRTKGISYNKQVEDIQGPAIIKTFKEAVEGSIKKGEADE